MLPRVIEDIVSKLIIKIHGDDVDDIDLVFVALDRILGAVYCCRMPYVARYNVQRNKLVGLYISTLLWPLHLTAHE